MEKKKYVLYEELPTAFNVMLKPIGAACNLNCTYCYYLEKANLYPQRESQKMSEELLEHFIKDYITSQDIPVVTFVWQGGEPTLLGVDYFKQALRLQKKYAGSKKIENNLQTNATLLTDEFCRFFHDNNFLIGVSLDGPKELHDKFRRTRNNSDTFEKVMDGINLLKKHRVEFNTLSVVNSVNQDYPLEVYRFLKSIGSHYMQFLPVVERIASVPAADGLKLVSPDFKQDAAVSDWSVDPVKYGKFLCRIFDEWVKSDVGNYYVQMFDVTLANWFGAPPGLCVFGKTCGNAMVMEHNGNVYSCDHFVYDANYLGNIKETPLKDMLNLPQQLRFGINKMDKLPAFCEECTYNFTCNGACPKHRFAICPDGSAGLNYLCNSYKMFFEHTAPAMQFMCDELKNQRPPANVMRWMRGENFETEIKPPAPKPLIQKIQPKTLLKKTEVKKIGKSDLCPCGSGKPFKLCCRNKKRG